MAKLETTPEPTILRRIKVRQIHPEERERYDELLKERHYLHSARLGGRSMRDIAESSMRAGIAGPAVGRVVSRHLVPAAAMAAAARTFIRSMASPKSFAGVNSARELQRSCAEVGCQLT